MAATYTHTYKDSQGVKHYLPEFKFLYGMVPAMVSRQVNCSSCLSITMPDAYNVKGTWEKDLLDRLTKESDSLEFSDKFTPDNKLINKINSDINVYVDLLNGVTQCLRNFSHYPR